MQLITPSQQTVTTTYTGGGLDVGTQKNVSATIPLYLERSVTDIFAPQDKQPNTATSTAPNGLLPGFYDPATGAFYQKVAPLPTVQRPASLVATIQQPTYTTTATPFKTVAYTTPQPSPVATKPTQTTLPLPKPTEPAAVATTVSTVQVSDEVKEAVAVIKQLMEQPAIRKMVTSYQQQGAAGLFNWATVRRGLSLMSDSQVRQSVSDLSRLLKSPDVQAAIRNPKAVLGNDQELNELLDTFNGLGLVKADDTENDPLPTRAKKKPVIEAEAASDEDEESVSAEALSDSDADAPGPSEANVKTISLKDLVKELEAKDPHKGHAHAKQTAKRHVHRKPSAEATED